MIPRCQDVLVAGLILIGLTASAFAGDLDRAARVRWEKQPGADLGNGAYRNPILAGDYGDPSVVRVGADFYMTHSGGGGGVPNLLIWHSRDLVNWRPIAKALRRNLGAPWAPDLIFHQGQFFLYTTLVDYTRTAGQQFINVVLTATNAAGPWSEPVDLKLNGMIDPGHVVAADGSRYLYFDKGRVVQLAADGLRVAGEVRTVYDGWPIPPDWVVECFCLESPKLVRRGDWFYLLSAQGGTSGPSTSHMVVVARGKSPLGPWENAPNSPLLRTGSREERWWSQGHGTLVDDVAGSWWLIFHAYENGFRTLGRQTLLLPVEWTVDGWPVIAGERNPNGIHRKPAGEDLGHGLPISDDFTNPTLGWQWYGKDESVMAAVKSGGGRLEMKARGSSVREATLISCKPLNQAYEATVLVESAAGVEAGLLLSAGNTSYGGLAVKDRKVSVHWRGKTFLVGEAGPRVWLRVRNVRHDAAYYFSADGTNWTKCERGAEFSTGRVRLALYAAGEGEVIMRNFEYRGLD
jgi:xylan 1,4-beta-xylosidase